MVRNISIETAEEKSTVIAFLEAGVYPEGFTKDQKRALRNKCANLRLVDRRIYFCKPNGVLLEFICPFETETIELLIRRAHSDHHIGVNKQVKLLNDLYYGISSQSVRDFLNACESCMHFQPLRTIPEMEIVQITRKYQRYVIDCIDMRRYQSENDDYCWILNVIDSYTKFLWSYKLKNKAAGTIVNVLRSCFYAFGVPSSIQSDNGKEFSNQLLRNLCAEMRIQVIHGRPRHPQSQGPVERVNQTIKRRLAKVLFIPRSRRWIDKLDEVVYWYNCTQHRATNQSPFMLFFGIQGYNAPQSIQEVDIYGRAAVPIESPAEDNEFEAWSLDEDRPEEVQIAEIEHQTAVPQFQPRMKMNSE